MQIPKPLKSKTITITAAYYAAFEILGGAGVEVNDRILLGGLVLLSWLLRMRTNKPLSEK